MLFTRSKPLRAENYRRRVIGAEALEGRALLAGLTVGPTAVEAPEFSDVAAAPTDRVLIAPMGISESIVSAHLDNHLELRFADESLHATYDPIAMPSIAIVSFEDGSRVALWTSSESTAPGVFGQRVDADGVSDPSFQIAAIAEPTLALVQVRATALEDDQYLVAWTDSTGMHGVLLNRLDQPTTPIIDFGPASTSAHFEFDVVRDHHDGFYHVYNELGTSQIRGRHFSSSGAPQDSEFVLKDVGANNSVANIKLVPHSEADYALRWTEVDFGTSSTSFNHFYSEAINQVLSNPILVGVPDEALAPDVAANRVGDFATVELNHGATGDASVVFKLWGRDGTLESSQVIASWTESSSVVPPTITKLDAGGFVVSYAESTASETHVYSQQFTVTGDAFGDRLAMNSNSNELASFLETAPGEALAFANTWISYDPITNEVFVRSRQYQPGVTALVLDLLSEPPPLTNPDAEPIIRLTGLDQLVVPLGTFDGEAWVLDHLEENVIALLSDVAPGPLQIGMEVYDPVNTIEPIFEQYFVLSADQPERLFSTTADEQIDGGEGVDTVVLKGAKHEFDLEQTALGVLVTNRVSAEEDLLRNIEHIRFNDIRLPIGVALSDQGQAKTSTYNLDEDTQLSTDTTNGLLAGGGDALARDSVLITQPGSGQVAIEFDGSFDFTPEDHFSGQTEFYYDTRLRLFDNAFAAEEGRLLGDASFGLPAVDFSLLPNVLEDGTAYTIEFELNSVSSQLNDLLLQITGGTSLIPEGMSSAEIAELAGQTVTYQYTKQTADVGLIFTSTAADGTFSFSNFVIRESSTGDIVASTNVYDVAGHLVNLIIDAVADAPNLAATTSQNEGGLTLVAADVAPADTDGSEQLSVYLNHLPVGFNVSDGIESFTADADHDSVEITTWDLANLMMRPPLGVSVDSSVILTVVATETSNGDAASAATGILVPPLPDQESATQAPQLPAPPGADAPTPPRAKPGPPTPGKGTPPNNGKPLPNGTNAEQPAPKLTGTPANHAAVGNADKTSKGNQGKGLANGPKAFEHQVDDANTKKESAKPYSPQTTAHTVSQYTRTSTPAPTEPASPPNISALQWLPSPEPPPQPARPIQTAERFPLSADSRFEASFDSAQLWQAVDDVVVEVEKVVASQEMIAGSAVVVAIGFSTSQVVWLLRGSTLVSKLLSSVPIWFSFDPLPLLSSVSGLPVKNDTNESLADIATGGGESR